MRRQPQKAPAVWLRKAAALAALAAVGSCASGGPETRLPELAVNYTWKDTEACSTVSPRLTVYNSPPGTARLRVELIDKTSAFARHGGGEVPVPPDGVIAKGALNAYRGPCPSQVSITYEFRVSALDASGKVIARGGMEQTYTPVTIARSGRR